MPDFNEDNIIHKSRNCSYLDKETKEIKMIYAIAISYLFSI